MPRTQQATGVSALAAIIRKEDLLQVGQAGPMCALWLGTASLRSGATVSHEGSSLQQPGRAAKVVALFAQLIHLLAGPATPWLKVHTWASLEPPVLSAIRLPRSTAGQLLCLNPRTKRLAPAGDLPAGERAARLRVGGAGGVHGHLGQRHPCRPHAQAQADPSHFHAHARLCVERERGLTGRAPCRDTDVLCSSLSYRQGPPEVLHGEPLGSSAAVYRPPFDEFEVLRVEVAPGSADILPVSQASTGITLLLQREPHCSN